jgi:hypothetical protein
MIVASILIVLAMCLLALAIGSHRQHRALSAQINRLMRAGSDDGATRQAAPRELDSLPAPVQRYLRWVIKDRRHIHEVRMRQVGTLRTDVHSERWMAFEAEHVVVPPATGFVWNARVRVAPMLHVRVRDTLVEGQGAGHVTLQSAFTVASDSNTPEMNSGSLHRYLAEAVWYPTALLPSTNLRWKAIDATRALATLTDHGVSVSLEFRFSDSGEVTGIYTPARWGTFDGGYRQIPWEGHFRNYRQQDGVVVPSEGEVGWYAANEWQAVWRGRIAQFIVVRGR